MRHHIWLGLLLCGLLIACGASTDTTSSGSAGANSGNGGAGAGGNGSGGTSNTGGVGGVGGGVGGAGGAACPDISCSKVCPTGTWAELDGCPSCACAAPVEMIINGQPRPLQHVTVNAAVTDFIGGIDRWIFDLKWQYDDPGISDEAEDVDVSIAILRIDPQYEPMPQNASWCHPEDTGMPLEDRGANFTLYGFAVLTNDLTLVDGFLSIRQNGAQFEGQASFDFTSPNGPALTVHVSAPFTVPVP